VVVIGDIVGITSASIATNVRTVFDFPSNIVGTVETKGALFRENADCASHMTHMNYDRTRGSNKTKMSRLEYELLEHYLRVYVAVM
jgi:hypothetical protein